MIKNSSPLIGKGEKIIMQKEALTGFEPVISCLLDRRFNQLSHRARHAIIDNCILFSSGGVDLYTHQGKIKLTNTLESRLELLSGQVSIRIRTLPLK